MLIDTAAETFMVAFAGVTGFLLPFLLLFVLYCLCASAVEEHGYWVARRKNQLEIELRNAQR